MTNEARSSLIIGLVAGLGTALCGASWQVATRLAVTTNLGALDLALFRYLVPGILLSPLLLRDGWWPGKSPKWLAIPIVLGGGALFGIPAILGAIYAPVAHMGAFIPASVPVFTTLLAALLLGERPSRALLGGLALVMVGVASIAAASWVVGGSKAWIGDLLFIFAGFSFSFYTIALRYAGLPVWHVTALVSGATTLLFLPIWLTANSGQLLAAPWRDVALAVVMQGFVAGFGAMGFFTISVKHLGASRASLFGALVPILAALGGAAMLAEFPPMAVIVGIALIIVGVALATIRR